MAEWAARTATAPETTHLFHVAKHRFTTRQGSRRSASVHAILLPGHPKSNVPLGGVESAWRHGAPRQPAIASPGRPMLSTPRGATPASARATPKLTARAIRDRGLSGVPLAMVAVYDFTMARLFDLAGVDILLVGDSLGMVVQGWESTLRVTVEEIRYHGRAVARAAARAHVVGDMPFMSYQVSPEQAVESAGQLVKEGSFEGVKLEGGEDVAEHVRRITQAGIPVMGHVGLTPQSVLTLGGFRVQGRGQEAGDKVLRDACAVADAGAYAVVLEAIPPGRGRTNHGAAFGSDDWNRRGADMWRASPRLR